MQSSQNNPNYYAIIPASVRYCKDLIPSAKLLYGEISALCNKEGYCWAGNKYFEELYEVDETTIQRWLKSLKDKGFIHVEIEKQGMITKRKIWMAEVIQKNITTPQKRGGRHGEKEVVDTAKMPPIIIQCSNTTRKQQQAPKGAKACGAAVAFFKCIEDIGLTDKEKRAIMGTKFAEEEVKAAVAYATHASTKIKTNLIKTIMWALKAKPEIPETPNIEENKKIAESVEYNLDSPGWSAEALSKEIIFFSKAQNTTTYSVNYQESGFQNKLEKLLNELKFKEPKWRREI